MKQLLIPGALCSLLICSSPAVGQAPSNPLASSEDASEGAGRPGRPNWNNPGNPDRRPPGLDPEEARRLAAAREKAQNDPTVRSLNEARDAIARQLNTRPKKILYFRTPMMALDEVLR